MGELAKLGKQDVDELVRFLDEDGDGNSLGFHPSNFHQCARAFQAKWLLLNSA